MSLIQMLTAVALLVGSASAFKLGKSTQDESPPDECTDVQPKVDCGEL